MPQYGVTERASLLAVAVGDEATAARTVANWVMSQLPIALSITAAGAGMVSLIGHAHDADAPAGTSWLLAGAVATGLLALVGTGQALADAVVFDAAPLCLCRARRRERR